MKRLGRLERISEQRTAAYDEALLEWQEYLEEEPAYAEEEYFEEEPAYAEEECFEEEAVCAEEEYFEKEAVCAEEEYFEEEAVCAEEEYFEGEPVYAEKEYFEEESACLEEESEEDDEYPGFWDENVTPKKKKTKISVMDRAVAGLGVLVLILAVVLGVVYFRERNATTQTSDFATVGVQLVDINMIGEKGLLAVADAQKAKQEAAEALKEQQKQEELEKEENKGYNEKEYDNTVSVTLNMTSVKQDLKIKFTNKETKKLVPNAPFSVTVTKPDKKTEVWSDEDMDGIIYKKGIVAGSYKVAVNAFTEERYADYILPVGKQLVDVKEDIAYKKVDVSDEVKKETEEEAKVEDTKKNETEVESKLTDTVAWVESTATVNTYTEVSKARIPDPILLEANSKSFILSAYSSSISPSDKVLSVGESFTVTAKCMDDVAGEIVFSSVTWSSGNQSVAIVIGEGASAVVTAIGEGTTLISYEAQITDVSGNTAGSFTGSCSVTVNKAGSVAVEPSAVTVVAESKMQVVIKPSNFTEGRELVYKAVSADEKIAAAAVNEKGTVTITGVAKGDTVVNVTVNYKDGQESTAATASVAVKVTEKKTITLDLPQATTFVTVPVVIKAQITNAITEEPVLAESSDTTVATVTVSGRNVTVMGVKEGSATITVSYRENGELVKASSVVTVKKHPKDDKETKLKDDKGNQLYVVENNAYREALHADYYTAEKFFVKGETKYTGWQTIDGKVYYFTASGEKVTGEQIIQGAKYNFASDGSLVTGSGTLGIDVSKWNGKVDWEAVKNSGISYVIIRCGYRGSSNGALYEDRMFEENIKGATKAGLKVGVYFFTQATDEVEAVYEASFVLDRIKNYKISYPVFLDVEASGGRGDKIDKDTRTAVCKAFCQTIQNAGYTAGIYANKTWLEKRMNISDLGAYKIWLAQYSTEPTYTGRYDMWQYTSTGKVGGISGDVDLNLSYLGY